MRKYILSVILLMITVTAIHAQKKGYKGMIDVSWGVVSEKIGFQATTTHGWQFNPHLFVGGGAGVNYYKNDPNEGYDVSCVLIPVFADVRGYFTKKKISPYGEAKIGALLPITDWCTTSPYFAPALGCKFGFSSQWAIDIAVEYVLQKKMEQTGFYSNIDTGGLFVRLGVEF